VTERQSVVAASAGGGAGGAESAVVAASGGGGVVPASTGGGGPASGGGGGAHTPFVHALPSHDVPHAPQFAESVARFASHPSAAIASQFAKPDLHSIPHATPLHVETAFAPVGHGAQLAPHVLGLRSDAHALPQP